MTFWVGVAVAYVFIVNAGLFLGRLLASRYPRRGGGGGSTPPAAPDPTGPSHAMDCPPLGTAFDRALLPGVFDAEPVADSI